jgi:hypothetical protein
MTTFRNTMMIAVIAAVPLVAASFGRAEAVVCAAGVYRAGCAGPNGAVVARRPVARPAYGGSQVTCARGVYRAGCAGPNGAVVRRY